MSRKGTGRSANPRGKAHLRRIQAILNTEYPDEAPGVEALDWARSYFDSNGMPLTDRYLVNQAFIALKEKYSGGFQFPPQTTTDVSPRLVSQMTEIVQDAIVSGIALAMQNIDPAYFQSAQWHDTQEDIRQRVETSINNVVSTTNLTGDSFKWEEEEIEEWE